MNILLPYIKSLLLAVERYHARPIRTTVDFEALSITIEQRTSERISSSTLKRLWGYVSDKHEPRRYTLDVLALYIGHKDFDCFCAEVDSAPDNGSNFFTSVAISSTELTSGDRLAIGWEPARYVVLVYRGDKSFEVEVSHNSKLQSGDMFRTINFMVGYPLYLACVEREGAMLPSFVAGANGGLTTLTRL